METSKLRRVGVDIGNLYLKIVEIEPDGSFGRTTYREHQGHFASCLQDELPRYLNGRPGPRKLAIGITGAHAVALARSLNVEPVNVESAIIRSVRDVVPRPRNIIDIGGAVLTLIRLNEAGDLVSATRNSLCAAGTGSFLDEQLQRLGISPRELGGLPPVDDPPSIASRCAVFAKSDLVHHQQAGRSKFECWAGLCRSMVSTLLHTLLKGRPLEGDIALVGGVTLNEEILRWLQRIYGSRIRRLENGHLAAAAGAAFLASAELEFGQIDVGRLESGTTVRRSLAARPALRLERSSYPSWNVLEAYVDDDGNEVRVSRVPYASRVSCFLGIDIGSTSTKLAVIDENGEVLVDVYRPTAGEPIGAVKKLFEALRRLGRQKGLTLEVRACATTGSGRKMVGMVIGADRIINEITCHVTGAAYVDSGVSTIFEIGGQDSKFMQIRDGGVVEAAMNYVCAAGTGSFVAEQARKLGYRVEEVGSAVMGVAPPYTSDRCTVFMEQDVNRLLQQGYSKIEVLAAVLYSVAQNYLSKVVGNRRFCRERIFFQGATARNSALVAAFEKLLGAEIVVSPYAHVMGAWGAALLARQHYEKGKSGGKGIPSNFCGLEFADKAVTLRSERCRLCTNHCEITFARVDGNPAETSWGYLCGREPGSERARESAAFRFFSRWEALARNAGRLEGFEHAPVVDVPLALSTYTYLPLFYRFLNRLGYSVRLSGKTTERIRESSALICGGEFCFPVKAALGHVLELVKKEDSRAIFLPHVISAPPNEHTTNAYFCPYVQSFPSVARASLEINGVEGSRIVSPIIDFRLPEHLQLEELSRSLSRPLDRDARAIQAAWRDALAAQDNFAAACALEGEKALAEIERRGEKAIVILGRPYNIHDLGLNLGLIRKIAELGYTVIPLDFLVGSDLRPGEPFRNLYWAHAQRIVTAAKRIRGSDLLHAVYFTNFNCGPDSFLESYVRHLFGDKPLLVLELDEHEADAGYLTRIEAFLDVVRNAPAVSMFPEIIIPPSSPAELRRRKIWIPHLHPVGAPLFAAAFRSFGYDAQVLPLEDEEAFEIGRRLTTGKECLPMVATIGAFVKQLRENGVKPNEAAYFMSTASGPCRFGQYALKTRMILNELGYPDIPILSPSTLNAYQGLPEGLRKGLWRYIVASDILLKLRCKKLPYADDRAAAVDAFERVVSELESVIDSGGEFEAALLACLERLDGLAETRPPNPKPLVGIVGEIYVRCNPFTNAGVIEAVERHGGEAWLAPLSEWFLYTAYVQRWRARRNLGGLVYRGLTNIKNRYLHRIERRMYRLADRWMHDRREPDIGEVVSAGMEFLPINFEGESILTVGRALRFIEGGASLIVNCAPFGCMPGTITSALLQQVQQKAGVPVVSIFYDGQKNTNEILGVYLRQLRSGTRHSASS